MNPEENNVNATQQQPEQKSADNTTVMGVLAYIGPLVFVPFITSRSNPFIKFHIKQGLVVFSIEVIAWAIAMVVPMLYLFINIINLAALVLSIIGIVNVVHKHEKELPFVGQFSKYFNI